MAYTIEIDELTKSFGELRVLAGLDLAVEEGSVFALLGPNGAGKTTTVRILSTLLKADSGDVRVAGFDVAREPGEVRRALSLTGQYAAVDEVLTARENLNLMARLRHLPRAQRRPRVDELLERFDLGAAADRRVGTYSGGMKRRLDLAMSLISDPAVVVLDEPTTGLDPRSRRDVWDAVSELARGGATVLLTTQYLEEADVLADRIAVIDHGRVVAEGSADELKARFGSETVELFFEDGSNVRVASDGSADDIHRLLDEYEDVQRIALHRPSLDDVFLSLTERV
jgi:ABC-2 type transport system ATP-binding protein